MIRATGSPSTTLSFVTPDRAAVWAAEDEKSHRDFPKQALIDAAGALCCLGARGRVAGGDVLADSFRDGSPDGFAIGDDERTGCGERGEKPLYPHPRPRHPGICGANIREP